MVAAIIGKNHTLKASFYNKDQTPFVVSSPVNYKIFSYNDLFILDGSATQSPDQPADWYANFVIPEGSPVPQDVNNQQYRIQWFAENDQLNSQLQAVEYFQVLDSAEPLDYDSGLAVLVGQPVRDHLVTSLPVLSYSVSIVGPEDRLLYSFQQDNPISELKDNVYITKFDSKTAITSVTDRNMGLFPYLLMYDYQTAQGSQSEIHTLYIASARAMVVVNAMRRYLDKARNYDIDPNLRWTDVELIHFVVQGLNRFNVSNPSITNYNLANFPQQYVYLIEKCAEVEALNALYLAENARKFEFTGASVTLNVDRMDGIKAKMDEINSWLDANLEKQKSLLLKQFQSFARTGVSLSSVTNGAYLGRGYSLYSGWGRRLY